MKHRAILSIIAIVCISPLFGQLNTAHNHLRSGDVLIKQQVEYKAPGNAGINQVWDFSRLNTIDGEYTLEYLYPPLEGDSVYIMGDLRFNKKQTAEDELVIGREHNTQYYYRQSGDTLLRLGHLNPSIKMENTTPIQLIRFPLNYGQSVTSGYQSAGLYSRTIEVASEGSVTTTADAYGKMILPSGDTLSPVLRVKTVQTIYDISDDIAQNTGKQQETYSWYSKGYRYPVFETVRNVSMADSTLLYTTSFFYPPQDHLYLDTDPDNLALLDELWKETENNNQADDLITKTVALEDIMTCKMYPNPVESYLNLEYELKQDAKVTFQLYSLEGLLIKSIPAVNRNKGAYYETVDCSSLYPKNYVLRITANNLFVNEIIIKK